MWALWERLDYKVRLGGIGQERFGGGQDSFRVIERTRRFYLGGIFVIVIPVTSFG
jgi:hypothetical protein